MSKILLLEDDLSLINGLSFAFRNQGFELAVVRTLKEANELWGEGKYDLLVLDVSLPDGTGYEFCKKVRQVSKVPIIFLTASDEEMNIIMGLDIGGDDYITKPFKLGVLVSRINALLRRAKGFNSTDTELQSNGIKVLMLQGQVFKNEKLIDLTAAEYKLPDARYKALDAQYAKEQDALEIEIAELEKAVTGYEQSQKSAEKFIALIDKYENFDTLTNTMLNEFVEKILVHERARKGSQDTTQEVEIYFNFVGRYIPPALQPVPLTPEEQEELRKKEERKDRLHQNYLRRKANGKQKEWEKRYNAKRKAQVEAAKATIRAEDMEKGIFTTVSQLPRQEPRKATVSASATV